MAIISDGDDGSHWQVTDVGRDVVIIQHPGLDNELVHLRLGTHKSEVYKNISEIASLEVLTKTQKEEALFWYGYFYAYMVKR